MERNKKGEASGHKDDRQPWQKPTQGETTNNRQKDNQKNFHVRAPFTLNVLF
jgi:hypothetical protein